MEFNVTDLLVDTNVTLNQVKKFFNINSSDLTNQNVNLFDLYEAYRSREKEQLMIYKFVAYIVGSLIILSNLTVVISSGLILRKGQQPKSTYLLLGNVSLADTIIGFSIIFGAIVDNRMSSNPMCIFQIGMLVCPAMVSIFSVGLIAVDRYIYILHGLYYQRWFNTTKVRIGIVCIWMIGVTLGFMPATGWTNRELYFSQCYYVGLFPDALVLLNSFLSIIPIFVVAVLYSIILVKALGNVNNIRASEKSIKNAGLNENKLRIYRGNGHTDINNTYSVKYPKKTNNNKLKRSASFNDNYSNIATNTKEGARRSIRSKSIDDLTDDTKPNDAGVATIETQTSKPQYDSEYSICTLESSSSYPNYSAHVNKDSATNTRNFKVSIKSCKKRDRHKPKEPNKWRAITIVMLTSGSFIFTWLPFFVTVIIFVFCEEKVTNPKCMRLRMLLGGPIATLAFFNSILNPLIYAWWHKGFQRSMKMYMRKCLQKCLSRNASTSNTRNTSLSSI